MFQILRVLNETAVAVRTKAMKCLSAVVEADPSVLGRADIQQAVRARLLDQSSSVREAAVDLIGKFICAQPDFIDKYYKMVLDRILVSTYKSLGALWYVTSSILGHWRQRSKAGHQDSERHLRTSTGFREDSRNLRPDSETSQR